MKTALLLLTLALCLPVGTATAAAKATAPVGKAAAAAASAAVVTPAPGSPEEAASSYAAGDYAKARLLWLALADKGDARAMNNLGVLYDRGQGVAESAVEAAQWFQKAAAAGHGPGMSNYGRMLEQGRGVPRNAQEAALWFRQAADKNVADAQYNLAVLYERGEGLPQSDKDAVAWYSRAAANQQTNAVARLGQFYRDGRGVAKNATRAVLLLYGAAMEGHEAAVRDLEALATEERKGKPLPRTALFGLDMDKATRSTLRAALAKAKVPAKREDNGYICDVYDVRQAIPGATEMAVCYGPVAAAVAEGDKSAASAGSGGSGAPAVPDAAAQPLGFVKIDYPAPDKKQAGRIRAMAEGRFGKASAGEGADGALWNLGPVVVATQYVPDAKQVGLMYMVPRVYHLTRQKPDKEEKK